VPSLLDLIETGAIGSVTPGSSADDVRSVLGEPSDTSVVREPLILKYEALEVTLRDQHVALLHVDLDQPLPTFLDAAGLSKETTPAELERTLASRGVRVEPYGPLTFEDGQVAFESQPGRVVIVFDDLGLRSISSSIH
jgi:hypothetical protein